MPTQFKYIWHVIVWTKWRKKGGFKRKKQAAAAAAAAVCNPFFTFCTHLFTPMSCGATNGSRELSQNDNNRFTTGRPPQPASWSMQIDLDLDFSLSVRTYELRRRLIFVFEPLWINWEWNQERGKERIDNKIESKISRDIYFSRAFTAILMARRNSSGSKSTKIENSF